VRLEADRVDFELTAELADAVRRVPAGEKLDVIANYTAFQHIRAAVGRAE
jgi:hypothetical protein